MSLKRLFSTFNGTNEEQQRKQTLLNDFNQYADSVENSTSIAIEKDHIIESLAGVIVNGDVLQVQSLLKSVNALLKLNVDGDHNVYIGGYSFNITFKNKALASISLNKTN